MKNLFSLLIFYLVVHEKLVVVECDSSNVELKRSLDPSECPGTCSPSIITCKSAGGKIMGICSDGKICCRGGGGGGFVVPSAVTCGASIRAMNKVVSFRSPTYPGFSGGTMTCEFTLQLNPATVGIRVDFLDLNLPTVPTNPLNFYESPNSVCDSDFFLFRGFSGWAPDFRCGNLSGYSFMIEREPEQPSLTTLFIMSSPNYRWNIKYTEIYFNEVESLDYTLQQGSSRGNGVGELGINDKKQWMWYGPTSAGGLSSLSFSPVNLPPPAYVPSMIGPPSTWQIVYPLRIRAGSPTTTDEFVGDGGSEVEYLNGTSVDTGEKPFTETLNTTTSTSSAPNNPPVPDSNELSRIVGGMNAQPNSIPWQVSLQLVNKMESSICGGGIVKNLSSHFCGGTIISDRAILTASHCFYSASRNSHPLLPPHHIKVVVGEHDLCTENEVTSTREYSVERIIMHFNYLSSDVLNDIALIYLHKPIQFNTHVHPITLPDSHTKLHALKPIMSGWGSLGVEENSTYPSILQVTSDIHVFSEQECQYFQREFLEYVVPDYMLSGKYKGAFTNGICTKSATEKLTEAGFGDSGGGLAGVAPSQSNGGGGGGAVLLGVVSHMRPHKDPKSKSSDSEEFHLNYFVKVSAYRRWILMGMLGV